MITQSSPRVHYLWPFMALMAILVGIGVTLVALHRQNRGTIVTVFFHDAHGLRPGAQVRYRGMVVGEVTDVILREDATRVSVRIRLFPDAAGMARTDAAFWIVRPTASFASGIEGLETVVADQYVAIRPGRDSRNAIEFEGKDEPLPPEAPGESVSITLTAPTQFSSLRPGTEISYLGFPIGAVQTVSLTLDGSGVRAEAFIRKDCRSLLHSKPTFKPVSLISTGKFEIPRLEIKKYGFTLTFTELQFEIHGLADEIELQEGNEIEWLMPPGHLFEMK